MSKLKKKIYAAVLRVAGTNCDQETMYALKLAGAEPRLISMHELMHDKSMLDRFHVFLIPGGFAYGDDIAAGKVFANELKYKLKEELSRFIGEGRLVIGVCNGFQVLIKSGFLPGMDGESDDTQLATLTFNDVKYEDRWVYLKTHRESCCVFASELPERFYIPVAHGEGKFMPRSKKILSDLVKNKQIVFQYIDEKGRLAGYPWNHNGSVMNIAGICNKTGNVIGMMPHPERFWSPLNHPRWTRGKYPDKLGLVFYEAAIHYAEKKLSL